MSSYFYWPSYSFFYGPIVLWNIHFLFWAMLCNIFIRNYCGILRQCFVTYVYLHGQYHTGYQEQMTHWPEQPFNIIIKWLKDRSPSLLVADFGCGENLDISTRVYATNTSTFICKFVLLVDILITTRSIMIPGDARLARNVKNKVFSFDLVSQDPSVIACDMSNVCLPFTYV